MRIMCLPCSQEKVYAQSRSDRFDGAAAKGYRVAIRILTAGPPEYSDTNRDTAPHWLRENITYQIPYFEKNYNLIDDGEGKDDKLQPSTSAF